MENSPSNSCSSTSSKSRPSPPRGHEIWPPTETMHHVLNKSTIEIGTFYNPCHKISLYLIYIYIHISKIILICVFFGSACFLDISFQKSSELPWQIICFVSLCQNDTVDGSEILQTRWGNGSLSVYPIILPRVSYTPRGFLAGVRKPSNSSLWEKSNLWLVLPISLF